MVKGTIVQNLSEASEYGIVIEDNVSMLSEEVIPSGVIVMWSSGEIEAVYEDEILKINGDVGI